MGIADFQFVISDCAQSTIDNRHSTFETATLPGIEPDKWWFGLFRNKWVLTYERKGNRALSELYPKVVITKEYELYLSGIVWKKFSALVLSSGVNCTPFTRRKNILHHVLSKN